MDEHDDVEFLIDGAGPARSESPSPPRRRPPRWLIALAGVAVLAGAVTVIARNSGHSANAPRAAASSSSPPPDVRPVQRSRAVVAPEPRAPAGRFGRPLTRSRKPASGVALTGSTVWTVQDGRLLEIDGRYALTAFVLGLDLSGPDASLRIVPAGRHRLWLVRCGTRTARLIEYDTRTLAAVVNVRWPHRVTDAVAMDGQLYLLTDRGVAVVRGTRRPQLIAGLRRATAAIAADPQRHRVIALRFNGTLTAWTYRPGTRPVQHATGVALDLRGLAITRSGAIWVGGFTHDGGQLRRLDARTLRPIRSVLPEGVFGPGAIAVSGGARVVWVLAGDGSDRLACVDARSGAVEQIWPDLPDLPDQIASTRGRAVVAGDHGIVPLRLRGCAG